MIVLGRTVEFHERRRRRRNAIPPLFARAEQIQFAN